MIATETTPSHLTLLADLTKGYDGNFLVRQWDGATWELDPGKPVDFTLVIHHPGALRAMLWPFDKAALGEAYIFDDFDIEGNMIAATRWMDYLGDHVDASGA